jgi:hypothetical protein
MFNIEHLRLNTVADSDTDASNENITVLPSNAGVEILGDNEEGEVDDSPTLVQAHVQLAKTYRELSHLL